MGAEVCRAVCADGDLELVAGVDPFHVGTPVSHAMGAEGPKLTIAGTADALIEAGAQVAVDFTVLSAARENLRWCATNGVHAVVGTTGFTTDDHEDLVATFTRSNCLLAPNFAIGAILMMRFAEMAAPYFETAEIIELHHNDKVDAPSGTAVETARRMGAVRTKWAPDPTTKFVMDGARGAQGPGGVRVHSVRMVGMVANQEVILGTTGQSLTIRHDTTDRTSFMPGVILAVKRISEHTGMTIGLDAFL